MINHVLVIPDGNRRYAKNNKLDLANVYKLISDNTTTELIKFFLINNNSRELTIFGLSKDNILNREKKDLNPIFDAQIYLYNNWLRNDSINKEIKFSFIGDKKLLPQNYQEIIKELEELTSKNNKPCNILVGYSGQEEIINAVTKAINEKNINEESFFSFLEIKTPIDLVIRTGFEKRISNAPLYQTTYSELIFPNCYYPELTTKELEEIINEYKNRERRYGK